VHTLKNSAITYSLLFSIILITVVYFSAQKYVLKRYPLETYLNNIIEYASQGNWEQADEAANTLITSWHKYKYLIALNYGESDFMLFSDYLARLHGAIKIEDETETVLQAYSVQTLWTNFIKIIPEP